MKRIEYAYVVLPVVADDRHTLTKHMSREEMEELNASSINYARDTALPILQTNVISPFSETLKKITFREAVKEVGAKLVGKKALLKGSYTKNFEIDGKSFAVRVFPTSRTEYVPVFELMNQHFDETIAGKITDGVATPNEDLYISLGYFFDLMDSFIKPNK